jgi:DNA polymerase
MKKLKKIQACHNCNLYHNQPPLLDNLKKAQVFWIGLSAVKVSDANREIPLSSKTNTGKLISHVEAINKNISYYKSNLVKCLPLEKNKLRYPKVHEMERCLNNLKLEIKKTKPRVVFLLGKVVSDFIMNVEKTVVPFLDETFNYQAHKINNIYYIPIHHPSYILVYKRKFLEKYKSKISNLLANLANC